MIEIVSKVANHARIPDVITSDNDRPSVLILGAGPGGLGAAYRLHREVKGLATVLEQNSFVGGNASSFEFGGQSVDFGSHRLHPSADEAILRDLRALLGDDLLERRRHGRIHLRGRWIRFPLRPIDLMLRLDRGFAVGAIRDMVAGAFRSRSTSEESFAQVLRVHLGPTICEHFYFPYARKIWGREPGDLSAVQARRRVSAATFGKLLRKVFGRIPGVKPAGFAHFFYPRGGFGQISQRLAEAAVAEGAEIHLGRRVTRLIAPDSERSKWRAETTDRNGEAESFEADYVWSTIPITVLSRLLGPAVPAGISDAAKSIHYRSMALAYLQLATSRFSEFDAHYFPSQSVSLTRLSEPRNYGDGSGPPDSTALCAEIPCERGDAIWNASSQELGELVAADLERAGIPLPHKPVNIEIKRLPQAYPIYLRGYQKPLRLIDDWIASQPRLVTYGRQGLFAHDNTHHALYMAYSAVDCLRGTAFDERRWQDYRREFETHVVED